MSAVGIVGIVCFVGLIFCIWMRIEQAHRLIHRLDDVLVRFMRDSGVYDKEGT